MYYLNALCVLHVVKYSYFRENFLFPSYATDTKKKKCQKLIGIKNDEYRFNCWGDLFCVDFILWNSRRKFTAFVARLNVFTYGRDAAAEKGNETSLLYLSSLLCLRQNAPSSYRVCPEGQKRPLRQKARKRDRPIECSDEGKYRKRCARPTKFGLLYLAQR